MQERHKCGEFRKRPRQLLVACEAGAAAPVAGDHADSRGDADGGGSKSMGKAHAGLGERIQVRGAHFRVPRATHDIMPELV